MLLQISLVIHKHLLKNKNKILSRIANYILIQYSNLFAVKKIYFRTKTDKSKRLKKIYLLCVDASHGHRSPILLRPFFQLL